MDAEPCADQRLRTLLDDDETGREFRQAAEHLENCPRCQARLAALAAGDELWRDARTLLGGEREPRWQADTSSSHVLSANESLECEAYDSTRDVLAMLGPAGHPEMLGRLGRYDIERVIGRGGMGIVLKAHDSELNRPIAIKLLAPHLAHVGASRERFAREGRAAAAVVHEHVVAIYNVESDGRAPFLVMQYVPGRSLQTRVDEDGPLAIEEILRIGIQAASGLAAAHRQGLVHRDVKPANILMENGVERAILTDFGLARAIDDASLTQTGILAGTPHYMSPEQATGGLIDHRSDLFSLGAVLYFMATGHPPFRAAGTLAVLNRICRDVHRPVWQRNREVPDELSDLIDGLLEKKPARRPASAAEVQRELAALLSRVQQGGFGRRRFWRGRRPRRQAMWAGAALLAGVAAIAAGAALWWGGGGGWHAAPSAGTAETAVGVLTTGQVATVPIAAGAAALDESARPGPAEGQTIGRGQTGPTQELPMAVVETAVADEEFSTRLVELRMMLGRLEAETVGFLNESVPPDAWNRELEAIRRDLNELEARNATFLQ